jgi:large subunit ribosomal protein L25
VESRTGVGGGLDAGAVAGNLTLECTMALAAGSVWVPSYNYGAGAVWRIDAGDGTVVGVVRTGGNACNVTAGYGRIWVANGNNEEVDEIDPATNTVVRRIAFDVPPAAIAVTRRHVWVTTDRPRLRLHCAAVAGGRFKLVVQNRAILGSAESRRLRRRGLVPGVLYGREEPVAISIGERDLRAALTGESGANAVLDVVVDGGKAHASVLKEYQLDPVRGNVVHVDLQEVRLDQPIHATVPLHLVGESAGTKEGGVLTQVLTEINVEALPMEVPASVDFDVTEIHLGESGHLSQVALPEGVKLLDDGETVFVSVTQPTREEEPEVTEAEELPEGEVAAAEAAAEGAAEAGSGESGEPGTTEG